MDQENCINAALFHAPMLKRTECAENADWIKICGPRVVPMKENIAENENKFSKKSSKKLKEEIIQQPEKKLDKFGQQKSVAEDASMSDEESSDQHNQS